MPDTVVRFLASLLPITLSVMVVSLYLLLMARRFRRAIAAARDEAFREGFEHAMLIRRMAEAVQFSVN